MKQLTITQRYEIQSLKKAGYNQTSIALELGVHKSTISRELTRNSQKRSYNALKANERCEERRKEAFKHKKFDHSMKRFIETKLADEWSPEQINGYCLIHNIPMVSTERIYQYVYEDQRQGGLLYDKLRTRIKKRRKRRATKDRRGSIPNRVGIELRPKLVADKERFGDWEGDTIIGKNHQGAVITLVERKSKFTIMAKPDGKKADSVRKEIINALAPFKQLVHTITFDNGKEFAEHEKIAAKLNAQVYFAHPYSSWERGLNENTNGLIRQYLPKKTCLRETEISTLINISNKLNNRPRKTLNFKTPYQVFMANFII
ncbi:MAG: IS30 family transposase [Sphingobacteriales bacterium]|nr:IS30 family transposase [Sphingobacteriales bacterium]